MKKLFLGIAIFFSVLVIAQEIEVSEKLMEYNFSPELLTTSVIGTDNNHTFDVTITSNTDTETIVEKAKFDPTQKQGKRWILLSHNENVPTKKEIKDFNKRQNIKEGDTKIIIEDGSWNIETDNDDYLVVGFKYSKSTLPDRYRFLGDCTGKAFFNKKTKRLEKTEFINEKPIKKWPLNVSKLDLLITYVYNSSEKIYQIEKETFNMDVEAFGQTVPLKDVYEYSNYKIL